MATVTAIANRRGTVLLEVLVASTFSAVLLGTTYAWARAALAAVREDDRQSRTQRAWAVAAEVFAADVRDAGCAAAAAPVEAVAVARDDEVVLTSDFDGDGRTTGRNERVVYRFDASAGILRRGVGTGGAQPFVDELDEGAVRFRYLDVGGNELPAGTSGLDAARRGAIAVVRMELHDTAGAVRMHHAVALRNR